MSVRGSTVGVCIAADPRRPALGEQIFRYYSTYPFLDDVRLYYRRNGALAVNAAAREMRTELLVVCAGDVFIGSAEFERFISHPAPVVFMAYPLAHRKPAYHRYPDPWKENVVPDDPMAVPLGEQPFISGLFRVRRQLLVDYPLPELPAHCEDYLWENVPRRLGLQVVGIQVPAVHVDANPWWPRWRVIEWARLAPERFHVWHFFPWCPRWLAPLLALLMYSISARQLLNLIRGTGRAVEMTNSKMKFEKGVRR